MRYAFWINMAINFYSNVIYLLQFNLKTIKLFFNGIISSIIFEGSIHSIIPKGHHKYEGTMGLNVGPTPVVKLNVVLESDIIR